MNTEINNDRRAWMAASAALLAGGVLTLSGRDQPLMGDTDAYADAAARARLAGYFPNAILTTHQNRSVRFYDDLLRDRSVVIGFLYTGCNRTCPLTMAHLIALKNRLRDSGRRDVRFYGISLDPANDTPSALAAYAKRMHTGEEFVFVTGSEDDITLIRRKLGVFHPDPIIDQDRNQHSGLIVIGHEPSGRWARLPGLVPVKRIMRTIERVAPRASNAIR